MIEPASNRSGLPRGMTHVLANVRSHRRPSRLRHEFRIHRPRAAIENLIQRAIHAVVEKHRRRMKLHVRRIAIVHRQHQLRLRPVQKVGAFDPPHAVLPREPAVGPGSPHLAVADVALEPRIVKHVERVGHRRRHAPRLPHDAGLERLFEVKTFVGKRRLHPFAAERSLADHPFVLRPMNAVGRESDMRAGAELRIFADAPIVIGHLVRVWPDRSRARRRARSCSSDRRSPPARRRRRR